jgi:hypothetical protein
MQYKATFGLISFLCTALGGFIVGCGNAPHETPTRNTSEALGETDSEEDDDDDNDGNQCHGADAGPFDPTQVFVEKIRTQGSGCPQGSVVPVVAPDGLSFTLLFNGFAAEVGPSVNTKERAKDCNIRLKLHVPNGTTGTVTTVDTRGFVELDPGVTASQTSKYRFPGGAQATGTSTFSGPVTQDYVREDSIETTTTTQPRCGRPMHARIDTSLSVDNTAAPNASGLITLDTLDGQFRQVFNVGFAPCTCAPQGHS